MGLQRLRYPGWSLGESWTPGQNTGLQAQGEGPCGETRGHLGVQPGQLRRGGMSRGSF